MFDILDPHADLARRRAVQPALPFISDWNGEHEFARGFLGELATKPFAEWTSLTTYSNMEFDPDLRRQIVELHRSRGEDLYDEGWVLPASGASGLLATIGLWVMSQRSTRRVVYQPPLYVNLVWWLHRLGYTPDPVADRHVTQDGFELRLPDQPCFLMISDPLWYCGRTVPEDVYTQLRAWQDATSSFIFVDGTFQYMGWADPTLERSAQLLDPARTVRLVCPTKQLALHGCRFAYVLASPDVVSLLGSIHSNVHGHAPTADGVIAQQLTSTLRERRHLPLFAAVREAYDEVIAAGVVGDHVAPECSYFLWATLPSVSSDAYVAMDQRFYELEGQPDFVRVNLLNPAARRVVGVVPD